MVSFFFVSCYLFYCTHCCVSSLKILDDKLHGTQGPSAFRVAGFFSITSCPTGGHVATWLHDDESGNGRAASRDMVSFFFVSCYLFYCTNCCVSCVKFLDDKQHGTRGASASRVASFLLHYLVFNSSHHLSEMGRVQQRNFMYGAGDIVVSSELLT
jgi:hypothetical protein